MNQLNLSPFTFNIIVKFMIFKINFYLLHSLVQMKCPNAYKFYLYSKKYLNRHNRCFSVVYDFGCTTKKSEFRLVFFSCFI